MKKLIFRKFITDVLVFFLTAIILMGLIVWTIQAINYFDLVTSDGHGLEVYFLYSILNFPKIIHRILPFIFFISLFYTIHTYIIRNEINIFWMNGIKKIDFIKKIIFLSIFLMIFQIFLGSFLSPKAQFKSRNILKNSNIDFFTSLIKEGKFINIVKDLTIFIEKENDDGSYFNIFLDDSTKKNQRMIYAKNGLIVDNKNQKIFRLSNGRVINRENDNINVFEFKQIDFKLNDFISNTIVVPKLQEISTKALIGCFVDLNVKEFDAFNCDEELHRDIKQELLKRIYKPFYILIISILTSFLIISSKDSLNYSKTRNFVFIITFLTLVLSESSLRYSAKSELSFYIYLLIPILLFIFIYLIFNKLSKHA
tara:strand:- start:203 stop:1306 length:1104 start_codon:yes stop_codon:yes gene_type:complete